MQMDCSAAAHRLEIGLTATEEHKAADGAESTQWVAETTQVRLPSCFDLSFAPLTGNVPMCQTFITIMDALKLKQHAKDQLHPLLAELMSSYSRFKDSSEWEGRPKLVHW